MIATRNGAWGAVTGQFPELKVFLDFPCKGTTSPGFVYSYYGTLQLVSGAAWTKGCSESFFPEIMNVYRGLYFSTLVGMTGGLVAALLGLLAAVPLADSAKNYLPDALNLVFFGVLVSVLLFLYFDRVLTGKMRGSTLGWGVLLGGVAGLIASLLAEGLRTGIAANSPVLYRMAVWCLCCSLIGLGVGVRWVKTNRARLLHTYAGGLAGGLLGGGTFVLFAPHVSAGSSIAGLMLAGAGTGFGAGIAPVLVRDGLLRFISSGDARAQNKLGKNRKVWDLEGDESYILGSASTPPQGGTRFQQGADISIPDSSIAPRHAVVFSKEGRYYIARHPDAGGPEGIAKFVLRIKGKTVVSSQELHPADDVLVGRTALRFESRKEGA